MKPAEAQPEDLFRRRFGRGGALALGVWAAMAIPEHLSPPTPFLEQVADVFQFVPVALAALIRRISPPRIAAENWGLILAGWFATAVAVEGGLVLMPCGELAGLLMLMAVAAAAYLPWGARRQTFFGLWVAADYLAALTLQSKLPAGQDFGLGVFVLPCLVFIGSGALALYLDRVSRTVARARELEHEAQRDRLAREQAEGLRQTAEQRRVAMLEAIEAERIRISRELHDGVAQRLAAVSLHIGAAIKAIEPNSDRAWLRRSMGKIDEMIRSTVDELLAVASGLRPPAMEIAGIESQIKHLVDCMRSGPVEITVDAPGALLERGEEDIHVYRIVQEALSNSLRHSNCSRVAITAEAGDGGTYLRIADDGRGFDAADPGESGTGLGNMEDRARVMGGHLQVRSEPDRGTVVECFLPDRPFLGKGPA